MQSRVRHALRIFGSMTGIAALAAAAACTPDNFTSPEATPSSVAAHAVMPASAVIASPVKPVPSVIARDANGTPLRNVRVTFAVTAGDGTIVGGSQLTDSSGIAAVRQWTLGTTPGVQTVTATAGGMTVTFTVNATNSCAMTGSIAAGDTATGDLTTSPCAMGDGSAAQSWSFQQLSGQSAVSFVMHSTGSPNFDTVLLLHRGSFTRYDQIIAGNDNDPSGTTTDSRLDVILGPGSYVLSGSNHDPGVTGPFTIAAESWSGDLANCAEAYVTPGVTTSQTMDASCSYTSTLRNIDLAGLYLVKGQTVQIDMSSAAFDPQIDFYLNSGQLVAQDDNGGGGTSARVTYTAPANAVYVIFATSPAASQTGAYTLSVTSLSGAPAPAARATSAPAPSDALGASRGSAAAFGWSAPLPWRRAR